MINKCNNQWNVEHGGLPLFKGVSFWAKDTQGLRPLSLEGVEKDCRTWRGQLKNQEAGIWGELFLKEERGTLVFEVSLHIEQKELTRVLDFAAKDCFVMKVRELCGLESLLAGAMEDNLWWMTPHFQKDVKNIPSRTQNLLAKQGKEYVLYLPMPTREAVTEIVGCEDGLKLSCSLYREGATGISGRFLAVRRGENPYVCNEELYRTAMPEPFPLRKERMLPERLQYFGFCSWDAFYTEVTAQGIEEKLREFRDKGIVVPWVLIDDGWMQTRGRKLCSFREDRNKFPEGLKVFVERIKSKYAVRWVGVWHSLQGYWHGIEPESELYEAQRQNLVETAAGYLVPSWEEEKACDFWNSWHSYLRDQGIDFVKVDNQGGSSEYARNNQPRAKAARTLLRALETSVAANFQGDILHCMGMGQAEYLGRRMTGVARSSDDFYPNRLDGFRMHALQNGYNSFFHGPVYWCDWDMWWTKHITATQSGVLRAISGGPVYVSDKVGQTDISQLRPLMEADGKLLQCDGPGRPVLSQLMGVVPGEPLRIWNRCNGAPVVAVFDLDAPSPSAEAKLPCGELLEEKKTYVAYAALSKKFYQATCEDELHIRLTNGAEIVNFYPVEKGSIQMGDPTKYISLASPCKKRIMLEDIIFTKGE